MKPHQKKPVTKNPRKPDMQKQSENVHTNYIIVDKEFESAKQTCEIRSFKEAPTSVMNISTKFVTDNRKCVVLQSKRLLQLSEEKGAFNWLTMLPI